MKCTDSYCRSPLACGSFGHCRNKNRPFNVTRLIVPPIFQTQLTGVGPEFRTITIAAKNQKAADAVADSNPDWFEDLNAVVERKPA